MTAEPEEGQQPTSDPVAASTVPRPEGLGNDGSWLWDEIAGRYALRPDEIRLLIDACREADLIAGMHAELVRNVEERESYQVEGSMGQQVAHGLATELRQHRNALAALLKQLKLPDAPGSSRFREAAEKKSEIGRKAARARWAK